MLNDKKLEDLPKTSFSLTFDDQVSAEEIASFLTFIHESAVEKGGLGLFLLKDGRANTMRKVNFQKVLDLAALKSFG